MNTTSCIELQNRKIELQNRKTDLEFGTHDGTCKMHHIVHQLSKSHLRISERGGISSDCYEFEGFRFI